MPLLLYTGPAAAATRWWFVARSHCSCWLPSPPTRKTATGISSSTLRAPELSPCATLSMASSTTKLEDEGEAGNGGSVVGEDVAAVPKGGAGVVSLQEWQAWGTSSPFPSVVKEVIDALKALERDAGIQMTFGGLGAKLQKQNNTALRMAQFLEEHPKGTFKTQEDKKNRAVYESLADSEQKLQFFSARQIACRLLGSRGYLCQKCWLPMEDCMCSKIVRRPLWHGVRFWLYMHPKDFLRQNNTGKLLWQVFGTQDAIMCLFGIQEQEDIMWNAFKHSGKDTVWFLYPNMNSTPKTVADIVSNSLSHGLEGQKDMCKPLNFVMIDGTWSNSTAMYRRLKERWRSAFIEEGLPCVSLSTLGASVMHKLRPQPSWDKTCTAAAAASILSELHAFHSLSNLELDKQADAVESSLDTLLEALTARRLRMGRSITRKERHNNCI